MEKPKTIADEVAARELELWIESDGDLYRQMHTPIIKNLMAKKARGVYDPIKAVKLFEYLTEEGARRYGGKEGRDIPAYFNKATRRLAAQSLLTSFETEAELGNYDEFIPKKYQKNFFPPLSHKKDNIKMEVPGIGTFIHTHPNPKLHFPTGRGRYIRERLVSPKKLYHMRTITRGKHKLVVGCPVPTHAGRCPVGMVTQSILHPPKEFKKRNPTLAVFNPPKKWYWGGGIESGKDEATVFSSSTTPTRVSHGHLYGYATGPFKTKKEAKENAQYMGYRKIYLSNPPEEILSENALELAYIHAEDGKSYKHDFEKSGTKIKLEPDGSVKIFNPKHRLWRDF